MPPRKTLQAFLATARAALTAPPSKRPSPLTFVVGNESADLDSLCSALLLAYFRTHAPPHYTLHIPLCNLPREDLALRPEFGAALRGAALSFDDVLTLSELPSPSSLEPGDTRWLLVDHNAMAGLLGRTYGPGSGASVVVGCIDHHEDEGAVPRDADPRVVERCGSCASLVVEHCRGTWDGFGADGEGGGGGGEAEAGAGGEEEEKSAHLARLALAPVLVDTRNLADATKTTARDEQAVAYAEAKLASAGKAYDRAAFFERLSRLKGDIEPLSLRDILRKDYKEWDEEGGGTAAAAAAEGRRKLRLGTSSVPRPVSFLVKKAGGAAELVEALRGWGEERGADLVAVLTSFSRREEEGGGGGEAGHGRELLVWARTGARAVDAARRFADAHAEPLQLRTWADGKLDAARGGGSSDDREWRRCWVQGKLEDSRKQVAPMLREAMKRSLGA